MIVLALPATASGIDRAQVVGALTASAGDADIGVRLSAIRGLGAIGPGASEDPPPILVAAIEDSSDKIRGAAAYAIVNYRRGLSRLIPALMRSMESAGPEARARYAEILETIRPRKFTADVVPAMAMALESRDAGLRLQAARSLASFRTAAQAAIPALIKCLDDRSESRPVAPGTPQLTRDDPVIAAAEALGRVALPMEEPTEAIAALTRLLKSGSTPERAMAATVLGRYPADFSSHGPDSWRQAPADPVQLAALTEALGDADTSVRVAALKSLHDVGMMANFEASPELNAALARALEDPLPEIRIQAARAITHSSHVLDRFFPALVRHGLHDPDKDVREMCAAVISLDSGPREPTVTAAAIPDLIEALGSRDGQMRHSAYVSLARFGAAAAPALPALLRVIRDSAETEESLDDKGASLLASLSRGTPSAAQATAALAIALRRQEIKYRATPASALSILGPSASAAVPDLIATFHGAVGSNQIGAAIAMATALGQIEPTHPVADEIIPMLAAVLDSRHRGLHEEAAEAASHFGPAAARTVPGLVAMLNRSLDRETPYGTRSAAARALGRIAPGTSLEESAVMALIESLKTRKDLIQNVPKDDAVVVTRWPGSGLGPPGRSPS